MSNSAWKWSITIQILGGQQRTFTGITTGPCDAAESKFLDAAIKGVEREVPRGTHFTVESFSVTRG